MARVTIEERANVAAKQLAHEMGWSHPQAVGYLYVLWHDSQELEKVDCTVEDLQIWLKLSKKKSEKFVISLKNSGFLRSKSLPPLGGDGGISENFGEILEKFEIVGNQKHIDNLKLKRESAIQNGKLGGRPTKQTIKISEDLETDVGYFAKPTSETQRNQRDNPQYSSVQFSTVQIKKEEEGEEEEKKSRLVSDGKAKKLLGGILVDLWQEHSGQLTKVMAMSQERLQLIRQRLDENSDPDYWEAVIKRIVKSDFLTGKTPGKPWCADFDFLIKDGSHIKIMEGKYDNRVEKKPGAPLGRPKPGEHGYDPEDEELYRLRKERGLD